MQKFLWISINCDKYIYIYIYMQDLSRNNLVLIAILTLPQIRTSCRQMSMKTMGSQTVVMGVGNSMSKWRKSCYHAVKNTTLYYTGYKHNTVNNKYVQVRGEGLLARSPLTIIRVGASWDISLSARRLSRKWCHGLRRYLPWATNLYLEITETQTRVND